MIGGRPEGDSQQPCETGKNEVWKQSCGRGRQEVGDVLHVLRLQPVDAAVRHLAFPLPPSLQTSDLLSLDLSAAAVVVDGLLPHHIGRPGDAQPAAKHRI